MNKEIEVVKKWLEDKDSVSQAELRASRVVANAAADAAAKAEAEAGYAAAEANTAEARVACSVAYAYAYKTNAVANATVAAINNSHWHANHWLNRCKEF